MVDLPLVPVITTLVEFGENFWIVCESAYALANSILSVIINGKFNFSAISIAPSFGVWVIKQAIFLLKANSTPTALTQCLITISPVWALFKKVNLPIKAALLEQSIIAGIGNIYADEVCFMSRLNPNVLCNSLDIDDIKRIIDSTNIVITKAIALGGTTIKSFTSSHMITGRFQNELLVHGRENEKCYTCQSDIVKIEISKAKNFFI